MVSFARAVEIGVDVLETDVHMTSDGVVVVAHDEGGERSAGMARRIRDTSFAELQRWDVGGRFTDAAGRSPFVGQRIRIPRLDELFEAFPDAEFNIDIKQRKPKMVDAFMSVLHNHRATDRVTLASFHTDVIRDVRARFDGPTVLGQREVLVLAATPLALLRRFGVAGAAVQIPLRAGPLELASRSFINKCHRIGLRVDFWTINDPIVAEVLLDRGADGVITDDPARLKRVFDARR